MNILRVFPRRTKATPDDIDVRVGGPTLFDMKNPPKGVAISVAFTWDRKKADFLYDQWSRLTKTFIGGPALNQRSYAFYPGFFLKRGYVITSRGCPNNCWFCSVWRREGREIRELPVEDGWNVLDDNLLACSDQHIGKVFSMLERMKKEGHRIELTGGLEAARLKDWHIEKLQSLKPKQMFFAYDTPDDLEPLRDAGKRLLSAGFTKASKTLRAYVLCGFPGDSIGAAEKRMNKTLEAGFVPMAMVYRDEEGKKPAEWIPFQRAWARPAMVKVR